MADGAMVCDIVEFVEMLDGDAAPRLFFIQKRLDQQGCGENFVAWRVQQIGARHMGGAHGFTFSAAQAILDRVGNFAQFAFLQNQTFHLH